MEQTRQQHSQGSISTSPNISIAQQIARLQMNRVNRDLQKKPQASNSNGNGNSSGESASRDESYATLQKPPPNLMKPKLQSTRKQQFHSPNGESFLREEPDPDEQTDGQWPKRSKKDDDPPMIISAEAAALTAACYLPSTSTAPSNGSMTPQQQQQQRPGVIVSPSSLSPTVQTKEQIFKNKLNPQLLSKIQHNMSSAGSAVANRNQPNSPNKAGMSRNPIPKLMSRTKAQYEILRSQVTRPKIVPKTGANTTQQSEQQQVVTPGVVGLSSTTITATSSQNLQQPNQSRLAAPTMPQNKAGGPPRTTGAISLPSQQQQQQMQPKNRSTGVAGGKLPPPTTIPTMKSSDLLKSMGSQKQYTIGARRGGGGGGGLRGGSMAARGGRAVANTNVVRRESLHSPTQSSDSADDEYGYSTPSPPPSKPTFRGRGGSSPASGRVGGGGKNTSPTRKVQISNTTSPKKKAKVDEKKEERIYGKGYKCPPMDKVASYLTKKGVRIWICLVCEETEQEISKGPMICCDSCEDWYHFYCVGIDDEPPENSQWFCKRCIYKKLNTKKSLKSDTESDSGSSSAIVQNKKSTSSPKSKGKGVKSRTPSPNRKMGAIKGGRGGGSNRGRGRK